MISETAKKYIERALDESLKKAYGGTCVFADRIKKASLAYNASGVKKTTLLRALELACKESEE